MLPSADQSAARQATLELCQIRHTVQRQSRAWLQDDKQRLAGIGIKRRSALAGKIAASKPGSFGDRFSSRSNFMRNDVQAPVAIGCKREARLNLAGRSPFPSTPPPCRQALPEWRYA